MNPKSLTRIGLTAVVATLATAATFLYAAEPKDQAEGKFHLIYRVIAPKVEVGAEVEIEPALITDGNRIYFAWDYCRWHYPERNYNPNTRYNVKEDRLDRNLVSTADQADLQYYCRRETYRIRASELLAIDNDGVQVLLNDATYVPIHKDPSVPGGLVPDRFTTTILRLVGTPKPKLLPAQEDKQPYVFLMSRSTAQLEKNVIRNVTPEPGEATTLLARLEQYKVRRRVNDPRGAKEDCSAYWSQRTGLQAVSGKPLVTAEIFYLNLDGDNKTDLVVRLIEDPKWLSMTRIIYGNGAERCILRNRGDAGCSSAVCRPLMLLKTRSCVYALTQTSTHETQKNLNLVPLAGPSDKCRATESYRDYEPT